jgi:hypothetical protein
MYVLFKSSQNLRDFIGLTLFYVSTSKRVKKLGTLVLTAESSVSEIEDVVRDNNATSTFFLTTPGRVLHLFGSKLVRESLILSYNTGIPLLPL